MTGRRNKRGVGMREVELPDPKDREAVQAAWDAFDATLPTRQPGEVGGDAMRRVNAENAKAILRDAGLPEDPVKLRRELAARGFAEDSRERLAADWLRAWRGWHHYREKLLAGEVSAETIADLADAAQEMGEILECWWWRVDTDTATGERREALALRGRKHVRPNTGQQGKTAARQEFLARVADQLGTRKHEAIAEQAVAGHPRDVKRLWPGVGEKAHAKIMNFLRNHGLP